MHKARYAIGFCFGIMLTGIAGSAALLLGVLGQRIPELWGKYVLHGAFGFIMGKRLVYQPNVPPPQFEGFTLFICDHPDLEDLPAPMGVMSDWGYAPVVVSKEENLRGIIGVFVGKPLLRMRRGLFIPRKNGQNARKILAEGIRHTDSMLLFPDKHRRKKEVLELDRKRFPDSGLTRHCVPRAGGVFTVLSAAVKSKRPVRVIDLTWDSSEEEMRMHWKDVTTLFIIQRGTVCRVYQESTIRARLLKLWREKEQSF